MNLLYYVNNLLKETGEEKIIFEREYFPEQIEDNLPFTVFKSEEEKMYIMLKAQELRECLDIRIWNQKRL